MKTFLTLIFLCILQSASAQFTSPKISTGVVFSDIKSPQDRSLSDGNSWKRGFFITCGTEAKIFNYAGIGLGIETNFTYQERKALEVFAFPFGDSTMIFPGLINQSILNKVPTSPQSKGWDVLPRDSLIHFPNFKYLDFELIPMFSYGKKFRWQAGFGVFAGILLNQAETTRRREHFPYLDFVFEWPLNTFGEVPYHKYDLGFVPKMAFHYQMNDHCKLGLSGRAYLSRTRLNDTFVESFVFNIHWLAYFAGVDFQYRFGKEKEVRSLQFTKKRHRRH